MIISRCFSCLVFRRHFLCVFVNIVSLWGSKGSQRVWGTPRSHFWAKSRASVHIGSRGGFQGAQSDDFGGHLGVFGESFLMCFWWCLRSDSCYSPEHISTSSVWVFKYFMWFRHPPRWLLPKYFCNIARVFGCCIWLRVSECRIYIYIYVFLKYLVRVLEACHKQDWDIPAYLEYHNVLVITYKCMNAFTLYIYTYCLWFAVNRSPDNLLNVIFRLSKEK